jgi:DNA-binding transcriptional MerR regulator
MSATETSQQRLLTIGAVCRRLQPEFDDISISKIRYLEDQGLVTPRRTQGGYRMYTEDDLERLTTILRLQRDEFLPLRVIRQVIASPEGTQRRRKLPPALGTAEDEVTLSELVERSGATPDFVRELEEFGLLAVRTGAGEKRFADSDVDVVLLCARLAQFGLAPRNLRAFRTSADRHAALLEQVVAPALRGKNPERRREGLEDLQALADIAQELSALLLGRDLRRVSAG